MSRDSGRGVGLIEFFLNEVLHDRHGTIICGRCGESEFGVGDMFVTLWWVYSACDEQSKAWVDLDEGKAAEIRLRVEEIGYYDGTIERLSPGHTAGLRFSGDGVANLLGIDYDADIRAGKQWSLRGSINP
jgi:hypothetical protein